MWKRTMLLLMLTCLGVLGAVQEGPASEAAAANWVVWMDGTQYVPEWSYALEGILRAMKPGETGLLFAPGVEHRFTRQEDPAQLQTLVERVRPAFEQGAHRFSQMCQELSMAAAAITPDETGGNAIRNYLSGCNQLLDMYAASQKNFWKNLEAGLVPAGARLLVLVQQLDVPAVRRDILNALSEDAKLRQWGIDLQNISPWEQKGKTVKQLAEKLKRQASRVDGFYLKHKSKTANRGIEVSKAFFSGVSRLSKVTGGGSADLLSDSGAIAEALK